MDEKKRALEIVSALEREYEVAECTLDYENGWQLMVAVRLAAQCTDARVNVVTEELFKKYPSATALADAGADNIESIVRPCGLGASKARDISLAMKLITERYGGYVPDTMEELLKVPGVGRKSANLLLGDVYGKPAIVVDTHCIWLSNRLLLAHSKVPEKVEKELRALIPPDKSNNFCHRLVLHGRAVCTARRAWCENCCLANLCPSRGNA